VPSLTELTKAFGVTASTLRNWTAEFADYLSSSANPPAGQTRQYSQEDAEILATVAIMRSEKRPYAEIHAALDAGDRIEWTPPEEEGARPEDEEQETALVRLTATVARFEGQLEAVTEERDHLRNKLDEEQEARRTAENRAVAAETRAEMLEDMMKPEEPERPQGDGTERPWWRFWGDD
jgi:DNA-binding transcriptional MerR regulator